MPNIKNIEKFEELTDKLGRATAIYFTEYHGLNVSEITELRGEFYKADVEYQVAKNSIIKLAAERHNLPITDDLLTGSTAIALSYDEPVAPAKVIKDFTKERELPAVKGIILDGEFLPGADCKKLADMPSKDELLSVFMRTIQSPLQKFVSTLNGPMTNMVCVLNNLKENKS